MEPQAFLLHKTVTEQDTAEQVGSGSLPVLATPVLIAWMEQAACGCCAALLEEGMTSVGTEMSMRHTAASPVGMPVTVTAELTAAEGRTLCFRVWAQDAAGPIGEGTHTRAVVRVERFMEKANAKQKR